MTDSTDLLWPPEEMASLMDALARSADRNTLSYSEAAHLARNAAKTIRALAATPAVGGDREKSIRASVLSLREALPDAEGIKWWCDSFLLALAQPASPLRGREDLAPSPCSDLSIAELIEWLDNPQWTNGYLNSDAANHMSAAAELIERLVSSAPPEQPAAAPVTGRDALKQAESAFEYIRLKLINHLNEPERSAFWKAVESRDAIRSLSPTAPESRRSSGEPVWPNNDEANDLDKGDGA